MSATPSGTRGHTSRTSGFCTALAPYIVDPESFSPAVVISYSDTFVTIRDAYPKASVHLLLLPRDKSKTRRHPFDAFEDVVFLEAVKTEAARIRQFAAAELRRLFGRESAQERAREETMEATEGSDGNGDALPPGRDWAADILVGVHAVPSMDNLHIHIISVDRGHGPCVKHRKHYTSFATPFFVPLDDLPLVAGDPRRRPTENGYLWYDFVCWRCGRLFGNRFTVFKEHLEREHEVWRRL